MLGEQNLMTPLLVGKKIEKIVIVVKYNKKVEIQIERFFKDC